MRQADIIKAAFEVFKVSGSDNWKYLLGSRLVNNGLNRDELEVMADFCEQAAVVITKIRELHV